MRVLLCTPYLQDKRYVKGGINVWGKNLSDYYQLFSNDVLIDFVSYDRIFDNQENTPFFSRAYHGLKDYWNSIKITKKKLNKEGPYDVLHLCTSAQLGLIKDYVVINEAHKHGAKVVLHLHFGRVPEFFVKKNWESILFKKVIKMADAVVAIDSTSHSTLLKEGYSHSFYLPNPLSLSIIQQIENRKPLIKQIPGKILFVGHVSIAKGVFELVEACKGIDNIELHIVGTAREEIKEQLVKKSFDRNNGEWLKIRGGIPHEEVIQEMLSCEVFVLPSYTEGFPNVILESMACGCAIVATNVGAIPEMLQNDCGIIVNPKNVQELRNAINIILQDKEFASNCRTNAKNRVYKEYTMPIVWNRMVEIWKSV